MKGSNSLTKEYSLIQIFFWMSYCVSNGFAAVFLQGLGCSNAELGMILAGGSIVGALAGPVISSSIDSNPSVAVSTYMIPILLLKIALLIELLLFPVRSTLSLLVYGLVIAASPVINSLNLKLYSDAVFNGRAVDFGITRGIGSSAYVVATIGMGFLVKAFGVRMVPAMGIVIWIGECFAFVKMNRQVSHAGAKTAAIEKSGSSMLTFMRENPRFVILLLGAALIYYTHGNINSFLINVVRNVGGDESTMGLIDGLIALVEIPVMVFFSRIFRNCKNATLLRIAFVCFVLKSAAMAMSRTVPQLALACLTQAPSFALYTAAIVPYVAETVAYKDSAKAQSLAYVATAGGVILASLIAGRLYDALTVPQTLLISCAVGVVGTIVAFIGLGGNSSSANGNSSSANGITIAAVSNASEEQAAGSAGKECAGGNTEG